MILRTVVLIDSCRGVSYDLLNDLLICGVCVINARGYNVGV